MLRRAQHAQNDEKIAELKERTGADQVDLLGHWPGTAVSHGYLTDAELGAERRANVGHNVNIDGQPEHPGVPSLAVWAGIPVGGGEPTGHNDGAENVTIPDQTHVEVATSKEALAEHSEFFTGRVGSGARDRVSSCRREGRAGPR